MFLQKFKSLTTIRTSNLIRHFSSALYISGSKAKDSYAVLTPYIDIDDRFKNLEILENNIKHRNLHINLYDIQKLWQLYKDVEHTKNKLEEQRVQIANKIKIIKDKSKNNTDPNIVKAIEKLSLHGRIIKEDLKILKEHLLPVEENVIIKALWLPNDLDPRTPNSTGEIVFEYLPKQQHSSPSLSHLNIGKEQNLLQYFNSNMYYFRGDLAKCELLTAIYFSDFFRQCKFVPFSNPDFSKSVIVEGCCTNPDDFKETFVLEDIEENAKAVTKLHLTGSSSLYAFMALHVKQILYPKSFPLKYSSFGRCYSPSNGNDLFDVSQASCGHIFSAVTNSDAVYNEQFKTLLQHYINFYKQFGFHFRVVYLAAKDLKLEESLRASIQMFSAHKLEYIEVGHLSLYDDFLSKRMLFTYRDGKVNDFPRVISGTVINVTKFLGCILEQKEQFSIPNVLKQYL